MNKYIASKETEVCNTLRQVSQYQVTGKFHTNSISSRLIAKTRVYLEKFILS